MTNFVKFRSFTARQRCGRAIAAALALALTVPLMTACSDEREEQAAQPEYKDDAGMSAEKTEQYVGEVQDPEPDQSIHDNSSEAAAMAQFAMIELATAKLLPTEGNETSGTVHFRPSDDKSAMVVSVEISGLTPGMHGFHVHQNGDCSAPDASTAGGHFNPTDSKHGAPGQAPHHVGDLGNIEANDEGRVNVEFEVDHLAFSGPSSILQKAVVVHAQPDDLTTDPSGLSGDRVACGVIRHEPEVLADPAAPTTDSPQQK